MKRRALAWVLVGWVLAGCAPRVGRAVAAGGWAADAAEIRATTEASAAAWNRGDLDGHLALYVDTVTFMTASGPRPGVAAIRSAFAQRYFQDGRPKQRLGFDELTVRRLGRDAALETGRFRLTGGGLPEQSGWFTLVWERTAAGWRVVHDHSS